MKLTLDHIQAKDLQDTSTYLDVQDPIIQINIGKVFLTTERYALRLSKISISCLFNVKWFSRI